MAEITPGLVKDLRQKTGAGMMDCKKALTESGGDVEAAVDWLRKKGLAAAAGKAGRVAAEGLVGAVADGTSGALVEVNSETDFVARNESFQAFVATVAGLAPACGGDVAALGDTGYPGAGRSVSAELGNLVATIGENIRLRRAAALTVDSGLVAAYVHGQVAPGLGRIGVLVALESAADPASLAGLGKQLAMHVAAAQPRFVAVDDVDPESLARERAVLSEQARASGKPEEIVARMVEGRLRKYYGDVVLTEQTWVIDGESRVGKVVEAAAAEAGAPVRVAGFVRFALGEGIERAGAGDFADEVRRLAG